MATDFTQDAVLHFLQSGGGSVRNSDLLLHFSPFIRDHADRHRNRELFKKFVNSVATVKQTDGVSYVVLRKKFKGHVPSGGASGSQWLPVGKNAEPPPERATLTPAVRTEKPRQKLQQQEGATPAPPGYPVTKTILPAAGLMLNNNNNVQTKVNPKQQQSANNTPGPSSRPAQVVSQTPSVSEPPAPDQCTTVGQLRVGPGPGPGPLPGVTPVAPVVRHHRETSQQVPETLRGRETRVQPQGGLHQEPPPPPQAHIAPRRIRHRQSYKTAVSCDKDEEEEEEEVSIRPLSAPLGDMGMVISSSSPCITPPSIVSSSSTSSSERVLPKIYIQDMETQAPRETGARPRGQLAGSGLESVESTSTRRSLPSEAERYTPSPHQAAEATPHHSMHQDHRYSQPAGVQLEPRHGSNQSPSPRLSSSHSNIFSSSDWSPSGSPRASGWSSSPEDVRARAGQTVDLPNIQDVLQRAQETKPESATNRTDSKTTVPWHHSTGHLYDDQEPTARLSPLHRSTDHLPDNQLSVARVMPWHLSTGDLYDDEAASSDGSMSSPQLRQHPVAAKRLSSRLRTRMCRSMGADLDQLLQEEAGGTGGGEGGNDAARLDRLHRISSSLSLHYNLSSSSLSSCSTPPRSHSFSNLVEGGERRGERRDLPTASPSSTSTPPPHHEGRSRQQSQVPLEPREHAWLVKGAAGAWPDIYSLFREDSSLLNRQDFISGFTVLHWIAKHGDHRVLNTLWYGVEKAGLTFDVNARATSGQTPLHIAAIHGNKNIMRLLVNKFKADVRLRDTAGKKPWQYLSCTAPLDVFQLLRAPARVALTGEGGGGRVDSSWEQQQQQQQHQRRRRRRHYFSTASGQRPLTVGGTTKVKRSSSIAAFLKHKSLQRFYGQQPDSPL